MKLDRNSYHSLEADREFLSFHQFRNWLDCPAKEKARQAGEYVAPDKQALLVGQYAHMALLTPDGMDAWIAANKSEVISEKTKKRYAAFDVADAMIARVRRSRDAMALLSGKTEHVIVFELGGVPWKAALDVADFSPETPSFCDLKTAKDFQPTYDEINKIKVPWYHSYWPQFSLYRLAYKSKANVEPSIFCVGVTKQEPADLMLLSFENPARMDAEVAAIEASIPRVMAMKSGAEPATPCEKNSCDFCRMHREPKLALAESLTWPKQLE